MRDAKRRITIKGEAGATMCEGGNRLMHVENKWRDTGASIPSTNHEVRVTASLRYRGRRTYP